jgi:hypothetical protein
MLDNQYAAPVSMEDSEILNRLLVRLLRANSSSTNQGRFIFTVLYLSILAFCFALPFLYYARCYFETRSEQRLAHFESIRMRAALERSAEANRTESMAVKRKYVEERRARILQLMGPVRMVRLQRHVNRDLVPISTTARHTKQ